MVNSEKETRLKMMVTTEDDVHRIKLQKIKKKYRYATGGSGRRFLLSFALRQLRSHRKGETSTKVSHKRGAVWTVTSTSQAADSSPKDDIVEEEDVSGARSRENLELEELNSSDNDKVKDISCDQFLSPASFTDNGVRTFPSESQNLLQDDSRTAALPSGLCPLEPTQFFSSLQSKGVQILKDIELHVSTSNDCHHPPLKDLAFGEPFHGSTPLLLACHYGDVDWVTRIVERWGADVNAAAVYFFNPLHPVQCGKIRRATPVFVAVLLENIDIVRYLVEKGADVSFKTSSENLAYHDMTPLNGAALQRRYDVKYFTSMIRFLLDFGADPNAFPIHDSPVWMASLCGVEAATDLINHGLDLEQLNSTGTTILHHWVNVSYYWFDPNRKEDSFTVVKLLVDKGANIMAEDNDGFTVILAAANSQNWNTVDYILEKDGVDRMQKIEAMEMAAAIILSESYNVAEFERAFTYWRRALQHRQMEPNPMQKTPLVLKSGQAGEWITSDLLEYVIKHPIEHKIQSFLVRLRICSDKSWGAVLALLNGSFSDCISDLKNHDRSVDLLDVLWVTLETIHRHHHLIDYESDHEVCVIADDVVRNLIWVLSQLKIDDPLFNAETFTLPLEVMVTTNQFVFTDDDSVRSDNSDSYSHHMHTLLELIALLAGLPYKTLTPQIRDSLRQIVLGANGTTLLHIVCEDCKVEDLPTVRLLLLSGSDPNAGDKDGNAPLHVLAYHLGNDAVVQSAAYLLLECGAQLERANDNGETVVDVWIRSRGPEAGWNEPPEWFLKPVTVPNLVSLCARIVRSQGVPYDELELPATLIAVVEMRNLKETG